MYRITYDGLTIFDPYGNANEVVSDASMSVEVNASAYLDFTMAITHPLYDTIRERAGVVTLTWDSTVLFEGIIESVEMDIQGNKSISCVSAMDYLNDTHVRPYSTVAGEADLTAPSSVDGYFQWLIDQHNDHVLDTSKIFDVGINQGANLQQNNFIYRSSESEPTTASEITDQILDSLGGYLTMRYEDGRKVLDLYADLHTMNAQIVDFGVNITDFTKTTDTTDQYTAILLHGGSPTFEGGDLEGGDWSHWETHPDTPLVGDQTHGGSVASYFVSGTGEYINDSFFYSRPGRRYKATVYVKNERGSNVTIRGSYQYEQAGGWTTVNVNSSLAVENKDDQWVEFSFDFQPNLSEYTKIRPRWYFDNVGNDGNRRVYLDDFSFSQIEGDTEVSEDPIGLKQVPDGVSSFDADVFKSGDVLYSTSAVERYGYKEEVFEDTTITNIDDLVQAGIKELNKSKDPQITLDIKAVDLALFMEGYTHLNVGDAVRVRSAIHDTDEFLMVNSITLDLQDPGQSEYVIGKAYDSLTGQQSGFLRSLNAGINSSLDAVASLDQTTKDQAIQIGSVEQVANQAQQTANNAQNTANNAQNTANSNKEAIDSIEDAQTEYEKQLEQMQQGVEQAEQEISGINDRLDQMDTEAGEVQAAIDAVRQEAQTNFETAKNAADAAGQRADAAQEAVDSLRESTSSELQNVKDSVSGVRSDVDAVTQKAADLASELDGTKATVEQVVTEQGEIKSSVSNAVEKADQSLKVSTQASQTATQAQTTATSAYEDAQTAITQSSQATQTANQVSLELRTNYQTKADADAKYATQASLTATSEQIRTEVSETYATQATVNALENLANNAVQTWMGEGVPSLSNKPASDWTTSELRKQHSGDLYYDTNTGYAYRFGSSDGTSYSWALVKDTDITKALADAAKAQETAEGAQSGVNELKTSIPVTYATKSELSQKADSITARVEEVAQAGETTSSKVAELELTADGLQTTVKEQASKIDQNTTTISQVSQKADSLSSTITQVSGRVDDVDAKADTAQGTANSALSQASRVEQSLDSFKTSVSRDYQTKTDALSQKSELEQNLNSFKTTVSETYTTKDEFNALEIGGTNLALNTNQASSNWAWQTASGHATKESVDVNGITAIKLTNNLSSASWQYFSYSNVNVKGMEPDSDYTVSFDILASGFGKSLTISACLQYGDGTSNIAPYKTLGTISDDAWFTLSAVLHTRSDINPISQLLYCGGLTLVPGASVTLKNLKIEKGNKPTAWSPAPKDFDGKYTSKTEFKQTTDKISATATAASQNASSALSKISSLEVSVDGIDAKVEENAKAIDQNVKTTSQVSQRVDSLSSTITQVSDGIDALGSSVSIKNPSFETGDLTDWTTDGFAPAKVSTGTAKGKYRFEGLVSVSSGGYAYLRSSNVTLIPGHTYRLTVGMAYLDQNANVILCGRRISDNNRDDLTGYSGTFGAGYWHAISGKITVPSDYKVEDSYRIELIVSSDIANRLVCDDFTITDITDADTANSTANSALSKSSSVEQNLNSFKTSVSQTYETKSDASSKQSSLQQSVNNLRTEVSQKYTTKDEFNALEIGGTNLIRGSANGGSDYSPGNGSMQNDGYLGNGAVHTNRAWWGYYIRLKNIADRGDVKTGDTVTLSIYVSTSSSSEVTNRFGLYRAKPTDHSVIIGNVTLKSGRWERLTATFTINDASALVNDARFECTAATNYDILWSCPQVEIGTKPTDWSPCPADMLSSDQAAQTYSTKSYVDQTARTVSLGVVEEYKNGQHGSALATQSDITATKDSITSTVSKTYLSKNDASVQYATKTQVQQTSDSLTVKINQSLDLVNSQIKIQNPSFETGDLTGWSTEGFSNARVTKGSAVGEYRFEGDLTASSGGYAYLRQSQTFGLIPGHSYRISATRVYLDTTQELIFCIRRIKDNSQLTPYTTTFGGGAWRSIGGVTTVPSSYSADETYRIEIIVNRGNNNRLLVDDVSIEDVTDASAAQSTANTANTNAQNAQNRVGNLETCIKMTTQGVRVGKISNGNFTGYSALVNSSGSFDVLDSSGNAVSRFTASSIELGKNRKTSTVSMCGGVVKFASNSGGTNLAIDTQDQGPITVNGRQLGMLGRSGQFANNEVDVVSTATNTWAKGKLKVQLINTSGVTKTPTSPYTLTSDGGIKVNVSGLYLISVSGYVRNVLPGDTCHAGIITKTGNIVMEQQVRAYDDWDGITHTEARHISAGETLYIAYKCEEGSGSSFYHPFVTITFISYD